MISVTYHLNPCPISPWPFVYALSSHLVEWGHIMQRNNGAPLCQLAPISRTYRLCQNSLAPTVPRCLWPEWGSFIQEASKQRHSPLNCARRNKAGGGWGLFVVRSLTATWNFFRRKPVFGTGWGGAAFREWKGNKEGTRSSSKAAMMTCSSGVRLLGTGNKSRRLHRGTWRAFGARLLEYGIIKKKCRQQK